MKIAIIGTAYPFRGGLASYNERLALELQKQGHEVSIYTFTVQYPNFLFPGKTQFSSEPPPKNLSILRGINSVNPFTWVAIGRRIRNERPDLVIIKFWLPFMGAAFGSILRRIKKNKHTRIITIIDNMIPHESRVGDLFLTKYFIKPVDGFVAMSKSVMDDILKFDTKKPKTLSPHPLFDNFGEAISKNKACEILGLSKDFNYILFFGLIRDYKGLDLLLEAFADERFRKTNIRLIIAGEYYSDKKKYKDLIEKHKLQDFISESDRFIPDSEVKVYFNAADLIVQPYKSATQSGVTQIAYHFNKPMIVTDVGGLAELCPHDKVGYVVPINVKAIADSILKFYEVGEHKFVENIKEEKKKYSWGVLVNSIMKLMEKLK